MNRKLSILLIAAITIAACNKDKSDIGSTATSAGSQTSAFYPHSAGKNTNDTSGSSLFITSDVANEMISSYVTSLSSDPLKGQTPDIHSFSISADSLRAYLANSRLTNVKLIFAHTMDYINAGNKGKFAGLQSGAITIILAGYDANGNYVYYGQGGQMVLDHCLPCPSSCPNGVAGGDLLQ